MHYDSHYYRRGRILDAPQRFSIQWWGIRTHARLIRRRVPGGRLLDIGCGTGHFLAEMQKSHKTFGIEISLPALSVAKRISPRSELLLLSADHLDIFPQSSFDVIVAFHVLEHLESPSEILQLCARLLTTGGLLFFATPNLASLSRGFKGNEWIGYRDPTHISLLPPTDWISMTDQAGLTVEKAFTEGFYDVPYIPLVPPLLQRLIFGAPGGIQALLGGTFLPIPLGETLVVLALKAA